MSAGMRVEDLSRSQLGVLQVSVLIVALCGIAYELIIATVSTYLLGNSVFQFSITIGLFMAAMGLGSWATRHIRSDLVAGFIVVEVIVSLIGGASSVALFLVFPHTVFYQPVMYALIIAIGALVGFEIPILTRILTESGGLRRSIANVLSLDYLGALVGSVAFPLLLLPFLGLFRSSFVIALLNLLVAGMNVWVFRERLVGKRVLAVATATVALALTAGMISASVLTSFAEGQLFSDQIVYTRQTPYQRVVLTRDDDRKHRMYLDGHIQFAENDEYRYHEALVHPIMSIPGSHRRVLILGGGDGLAAREILKHRNVERIDLVDIDPAVTELASSIPAIRRLNEDALSDPRVHVHHVDAFNYVRETARRYDRVIIDLPDPHNEALNKLYSVEFYRLLKNVLAPGAYLVSQSTSPFFTREVFWSIAKTLEAAGMETFSYQTMIPSFGMWGFTLASPDAEIPQTFDVTVPTRFLTAEVMERAATFGKDTARIDVPVNSMFEPRLYQLYERGTKR